MRLTLALTVAPSPSAVSVTVPTRHSSSGSVATARSASCNPGKVGSSLGSAGSRLDEILCDLLRIGDGGPDSFRLRLGSRTPDSSHGISHNRCVHLCRACQSDRAQGAEEGSDQEGQQPGQSHHLRRTRRCRLGMTRHGRGVDSWQLLSTQPIWTEPTKGSTDTQVRCDREPDSLLCASVGTSYGRLVD